MSYTTPDGRKLPSVTQIIGDCTDKSSALTYWAANCAIEHVRQHAVETEDAETGEMLYCSTNNDLELARKGFRDVSDTALDVGSQVHDIIEHICKQQTVRIPEDDQIRQAVDAFLLFKDTHNMQTESVETRVFSDGFAGTLDWKGFLDGKKYVIDWKTSKAIYPEYRYQIAAYRSLTDAEGCGILRIDKSTGKPQWKDTSKTYKHDLKVFKLMVELFHARHPKLRKEARYGINS